MILYGISYDTTGALLDHVYSSESIALEAITAKVLDDLKTLKSKFDNQINVAYKLPNNNVKCIPKMYDFHGRERYWNSVYDSADQMVEITNESRQAFDEAYKTAVSGLAADNINIKTINEIIDKFKETMLIPLTRFKDNLYCIGNFMKFMRLDSPRFMGFQWNIVELKLNEFIKESNT